MHTSKRSLAFTLVELMIIVAILADLAVIALPAFIRSRNLAQNSRFIADLRTAAGAFEMYAAENNKYPPSAAASVIPSGMSVYMGAFPWSSDNAIGGQWVWAPNYQSCTATVELLFQNPMDDLRMLDIDTRMDNGILATGAFREVDSTHYFYIIEQ
jgi:type II secretory pathway pseudopilin PulG